MSPSISIFLPLKTSWANHKKKKKSIVTQSIRNPNQSVRFLKVKTKSPRSDKYKYSTSVVSFYVSDCWFLDVIVHRRAEAPAEFPLSQSDTYNTHKSVDRRVSHIGLAVEKTPRRRLVFIASFVVAADLAKLGFLKRPKHDSRTGMFFTTLGMPFIYLLFIYLFYSFF